uniref:Uncharacterized protein n=1 Tax=Arundo donax TaxID=35708 RepID=A0A0A8ZQ04_ARUDO
MYLLTKNTRACCQHACQRVLIRLQPLPHHLTERLHSLCELAVPAER